MYETLVMLKPGVSFTVDDLHRVVLEVMRSGSAKVIREGAHVRVVGSAGSFDIAWQDGPQVVKESDEIAGKFGIACRGCQPRFEITGNDPDRELFNDYLLISERLWATGNFVIFDKKAAKLLFEESD